MILLISNLLIVISNNSSVYTKKTFVEVKIYLNMKDYIIIPKIAKQNKNYIDLLK